jgi:hypothetical protein
VRVSDSAIVRILTPACEHDIALPMSVRKARARNWPSVRRSQAPFDWARWYAAAVAGYTPGTISRLGGMRGPLWVQVLTCLSSAIAASGSVGLRTDHFLHQAPYLSRAEVDLCFASSAWIAAMAGEFGSVRMRRMSSRAAYRSSSSPSASCA